MDKLEKRFSKLFRRRRKEPKPEPVEPSPEPPKKEKKRPFWKRRKPRDDQARAASEPAPSTSATSAAELKEPEEDRKPVHLISLPTVSPPSSVSSIELDQIGDEDEDDDPTPTPTPTPRSPKTRRRREETWHGGPPKLDPPQSWNEVPFIDTDVGEVAPVTSEVGTSSLMSSMPQLTKRELELGSRESGYISATSLSPRDYRGSCELLTPTPRPLRAVKLRFKQQSQEAVNFKEKLERAMTSSALNRIDPVDRFMKHSVYKTKYVTCVLEARDGGLEDLVEDALAELQRWLGRGKMLVAACEVHFSVPLEKRVRNSENRLKTSLLAALRDNNQRIISLRRGSEQAPIELIESRTQEDINRNHEHHCVQGVYQRSYSRLLRYAHDQTPEWHRPYWEMHSDVVKPRPGSFLWDQPLDALKTTALLITAKHVLSNSNASRILRIQLENVDDNPPKIGESAIRLFTFKKSVPIGRLEAEDTDDDAIFYYLIPSCSPLSHLFTLDPEFGELTFSGDEDVRLPTELCAIASPNRSLDVSSIAFDSSRSDMVRIVVASDEEIHEDIADLIQLSRKEIVTDGLFSDIKFSPPLMSNHVRSLNFSIVDVQFKPSEMVPPLATALPLKTLFDVNEAGEVIPLPILRKQPQGIYDVKVEAKSSHDNSVTYNEKVHLVEKKHKLKFMINDSADRISQRLDSLRKQISDVFSTADRQVQIVPDQPRTSATNSSKSTLCFHAVVDGTILLPKNAMKLISQQAGSNVKVAQIFNSFGIGNIEDCLAPEVAPDAEPLFAQPSTVLLVAIVAFFTFILFCLIVYICFVRKYKSYLLAKEKAMHGSPAAEQFASPTFVLAPPAPMPMLNYYD